MGGLDPMPAVGAKSRRLDGVADSHQLRDGQGALEASTTVIKLALGRTDGSEPATEAASLLPDDAPYNARINLGGDAKGETPSQHGK